jgi:hypothetical protein
MVAGRTDRPFDGGVPIDREHDRVRLEQSRHRAQRLIAHLVQNVERKHPIGRTAQPRDFRGMYRTEVCERFCHRLRPQQIEYSDDESKPAHQRSGMFPGQGGLL